MSTNHSKYDITGRPKTFYCLCRCILMSTNLSKYDITISKLVGKCSLIMGLRTRTTTKSHDIFETIFILMMDPGMGPKRFCQKRKDLGRKV